MGGLSVAAVIYFAMLAVLGLARRSASTRLMTPVVLLLAAVPVASIYVLGPGPGSTGGFLAVGVFAILFLGRAAGVAWWAFVALALALVFVVHDHGDRVGPPGLWSAPRWLVVNGAVAALAWLGTAMVAVDAVMHSLAASIAEQRGALQRERAERDGRLASERALAAASRLEAIGRLSAGVVHDTRNVMAVLRSGLAELEQRPADADERELLADMRSALEASQETMRQLLSLGAEPAGAAQDVELAERVERFARAVGRVLPSSITVQVEPRAAGRARVSPGLLDQALLNLTLNARDAMPRGGVLRLGVERLDGGGRALLAIDVEDRGQGIPPEVASRLFEPFATSKPDGKGTGLGLAMVQGFVTAAGGRVEVESRAGQGTRFRLLLPAS
jgi:signal transduction histidine kinase